ncbi:MAG: 50S ribosomal protein L15, partial [Nanoarchaeota archaeon]
MKLKKRRKFSRWRGSRTHGRGRKNRTRGSGNQGGVGMSGTGKRGDQKKTLVINLYGNDYFGKDKT